MKQARDPAARLDQIIQRLLELNAEADAIIDDYAATHLADRGVPNGIIKTCELTNRAAHMLNISDALRILRERIR
jgi:hypothetical protein